MTTLFEPIIRDATAADLAKIKEIIDMSFPLFYRYFAGHSASDPDALVLVAEVEGKVAGFTKLIEFNIGAVRCGCILWIAVDPAYRHRGVALSLTKGSVDCLRWRGSGAVFASTQRGNVGAFGDFEEGGVWADWFCGFVALVWVEGFWFLWGYLVCAG